MLASTLPARRRGRALLAAFAAAVLASCSASDGITPPVREPAALQVVSRDPQPGVAGQLLPEAVVVRVVDEDGEPMAGVHVQFTVTAGGGQISPAAANTDEQGQATVSWALGPAGEQRAVAATTGLNPVPLQARIVAVDAQAAPMLGTLADHIRTSIDRLVQGLPQNPAASAFMHAKLEMLRTPGLGGDIVDGHRYVLGSVASRSGASLPVTAVFPLESMRAEAAQPVRLTEAAIPVLESFISTSYPAPAVRIWYGFIVGASGGGGVAHLEDKTTYMIRTGGAFLPFEPMVVHELSHTWFGSESLTQFMELYGYNLLTTGSQDPRSWMYTRNWVPGQETNEGVHALLDVYELIGPAPMGRALQAIVPLRPPYGQPLPAAAQQVFVDAAPEAAKAVVAAKVAKVRA